MLLIGGIVFVDRMLIDRIEPKKQSFHLQTGFRRKRPQVVLLGNSICETAFHPGKIEEQLKAAGIKKTVFRYGISASGMGVWYLALKNDILKADPPPETVVISARSNIFLSNYYGFAASHRRQFLPIYGDRYMDPVIDAKIMSAGSANLSMEQMLHPISNAYYNRQIYQEAARTCAIQMATAFADGVATVSDDNAMKADVVAVRDAVGTPGGLAGLLRSRYNEPDSENKQFLEGSGPDQQAFVWRNTDELDGEQLVASSLLPDMIRLCELANVKCVVVRHVPNPKHSADDLEKEEHHWRLIKDYISKHHRDTKVIDLKPCPGIESEHFVRGDHFNSTARDMLSVYFANQFAAKLYANRSRLADSGATP